MKNLDEYSSFELLTLYKQRLQNSYIFYQPGANKLDSLDLENELIERLLEFDKNKNYE